MNLSILFSILYIWYLLFHQINVNEKMKKLFQPITDITSSFFVLQDLQLLDINRKCSKIKIEP